ncbi:Bug family tripartite tricarboxylate transporter substrate binding protein [Rhodoplanes sp. Z2-YC6860]|uniref:Bug family tripartite tricarboxylate transporter substrate binding protein n=1 Tax=Rhodoplanes sp. Z2-YC6860 TaxID=674703 RepID=UPI00078EAACC|nr:tripartite tricarboxylate transporter substrate binding protein [Rhodoplanes sp. Z2-YC6860]AMN39598.1 tricarboxylate transport protein [Rhodoplanes sp. Z2-YC6860]
MRWFSNIGIAFVIFITSSVAALAQNYPSRPIVMVVPFSAGGTFDVLGRIVAPRMSEILGQQVIVENTTGAGGIVGVTRVVNAAPDGYTLLLGSVGTHAYNQWIYKKRRYDAVHDFTPVALWSEQPMVLETRKDLPANTIPEFVALLKSKGSKMQFGSAGAGTTTHLACALLNATIGVNVTHVPYRGSAPASNDLIGGQIDYLCGNLGAATPLIAGKQIKVIATLSKDRSPLMADLPSAHEQGLAGIDITTWSAFFLPKGAPAAVVAKLNEAVHAAMDTPAIKTRMTEIGVTGIAPPRRSPEYLASFVADEVKRWEGPIVSGGLQVD